MKPTTQRREVLKSIVASDSAKATAEAAIANEELQLTTIAEEANRQRLASAVDDGARTFEAMSTRIDLLAQIKNHPDPAQHSAELRRMRDELVSIDAAIVRFARGIETAATVAADPLAHANELLSRYPALGGA